MEQVKVLSAALALREFTVDELSALSGVKQTSVRSVLNRNPELVHRTGAAQASERGRPRTTWAIANSSASRKLAAEIDALAATEGSASLSSVEQRPSTAAPVDRRRVAVSGAERALSQFLDEQDVDVKREILTSAQVGLRYANDRTESPSRNWWRNDDSQMGVRARAVDSLATLAATPQMGLSDELLERTAGDVAAAMIATPTRGAALYFAPFAQVVAAHNTLPAVLWISDRGNPPMRITNNWSLLRAGGVDLGDAHVRTQSWATPLLEVSAPLPMLLSSAGRNFVSTLLARTRTVPRPTLVIGHSHETDLPLIAARWGASFVTMDWRSSKDFERAIDAVTASIDRHVAPDVLDVVAVKS